jgi:hypothetical protein
LPRYENGENGESDEYKAAASAADKIESALIEVPSNGAVGFAIKSYLALHADDADYDDAAALGDHAINPRFASGAAIGEASGPAPSPNPAASSASRAAAHPLSSSWPSGWGARAAAASGASSGTKRIASLRIAASTSQLTEAERDLVETLTRLGYKNPAWSPANPESEKVICPGEPDACAAHETQVEVANDEGWNGTLTAAQERFAAAVCELNERSRRRAADAEAKLEAHGCHGV